MDIRIDYHAKERATNEEEINDIHRNGKLTIAKGNRLAKEKVYSFNKDWKMLMMHDFQALELIRLL